VPEVTNTIGATQGSGRSTLALIVASPSDEAGTGTNWRGLVS
jgi:hypothetical protein